MILLSDFDHFRDNKLVQFKEEIVFGKSFTTISYQIADSEFWKIPLALETRGICFDTESGLCVSRPFQKFFNCGEREETLDHNLPWNDPYEITVKRDGSFIGGVLIGSEIKYKTKKSFYSEVANVANESAGKEVKALTRTFLEKNQTPIFEFTSPFNRVVIGYGDDPEFTLIAVRDNESGDFLPRDYLEEVCQSFSKVNLIEKVPSKSKEEIDQEVLNTKGEEGYVFHFLKQKLFVKRKFNWYLLLHRLNTELRERDVARLVISETLDDAKSLASSVGHDITKLEKIESKVISELTEIQQEVESLVNSVQGQTVKDIALQFKEHILFSLIMMKVRGREPKYKEFWERNYLNNYPLKCVFNENF